MTIKSILLAMGKLEEAARCRAEIKSFLVRENLLYLLPVFSAYETRIKIMDGDKAAAKIWLENYFVTEARNLELYKTFLHFTTVRAYIALGENRPLHKYHQISYQDCLPKTGSKQCGGRGPSRKGFGAD